MWKLGEKTILEIKDLPEGVYGFIYKTTHIPTGVAYIGKKVLYHNVKRKLTQKELAEHRGSGRKPVFKTVQKESDWKTYYGSAKPIMETVKKSGGSEFEREILQLVYSKKLLTYFECKYLFMYGVLENPDMYYNDNIQGRFFTGDFKS